MGNYISYWCHQPKAFCFVYDVILAFTFISAGSSFISILYKINFQSKGKSLIDRSLLNYCNSI